MCRLAQAALAGLLACWACASLAADTIFLKDGAQVVGDILERTREAVVIREQRTGKERTIQRAQIDLILAGATKQEPVAPKPAVAETKAEPEAKAEGAAAEGVKPETTTEGAAAEGVKPEAKAEGAAAEGAKPETKVEDAAAEGAKPEAKAEGAAAEGAKPEAKAEPGKAEGAKPETKAEAGAAGSKEAEKPKLSPELRRLADDAMAKLDSDDPNVRAAGKQALLGAGADIVPAVVEGLYHRRAEARTACAELLGELNARNAVKQLIEAFYAAMPEKGECAAYQRIYVRALGDALPKVTGQSYVNVEARSPLVQDGLKKYIEWYQANFDRLPPQVGEEPIKPTDPEYSAKIKEARKLNLAKREWPRPPLPADTATGVEKSEIPEGGATTRQQDVDYGESIQKVDRKTLGGVVREGEENLGDERLLRKKGEQQE